MYVHKIYVCMCKQFFKIYFGVFFLDCNFIWYVASCKFSARLLFYYYTILNLLFPLYFALKFRIVFICNFVLLIRKVINLANTNKIVSFCDDCVLFTLSHLIALQFGANNFKKKNAVTHMQVLSRWFLRVQKKYLKLNLYVDIITSESYRF